MPEELLNRASTDIHLSGHVSLPSGTKLCILEGRLTIECSQDVTSAELEQGVRQLLLEHALNGNIIIR